jgi:Protein of unknown function (DUF3040)
VPLSDKEQKILAEIEKNLYEEDPRFARGVAQRSRSDAARTFRFGVAAFVLGFLTLIGFFVSQILIVGVLAFAGMVVGMMLVASAARTFATARRGPVQARVSGALSRWEMRLRERYKRKN